MALEMNDLMMLRGMDSKEGLTPYEQFDVARHQAKKPSGVAIAGLTVASVGAAAAIVVAFFGITIAAVQTDLFGLVPSGDKVESDSRAIVQSERTEVAMDETTAETMPAVAEPRLYDNVTLEQMLTELAAYYQVDVEYRSDDVRSVRLYYQWEPDYSLDKVVEMLSHFEAFNIHREGDKLIVESSQEGEQ